MGLPGDRGGHCSDRSPSPARLGPPELEVAGRMHPRVWGRDWPCQHAGVGLGPQNGEWTLFCHMKPHGSWLFVTPPQESHAWANRRRKLCSQTPGACQGASVVQTQACHPSRPPRPQSGTWSR